MYRQRCSKANSFIDAAIQMHRDIALLPLLIKPLRGHYEQMDGADYRNLRSIEKPLARKPCPAIAAACLFRLSSNSPLWLPAIALLGPGQIRQNSPDHRPPRCANL
jgi:hypothetical protein